MCIRDRDKAEGEAMDISHGIPFASPMRIYAGDYDDVADAAIVIISAEMCIRDSCERFL